MGGCLSSSSESTDESRHQKPSANVVSINGQLRQYPLPTTVSQVLQSQTLSPDSFFLCNSDRLCFDDYIPYLDLEEELEPAQIYFVLPTARLHNRLAASDMAALAVKASVALEQINNGSNRRRKRKIQISPILVSEEDPQSNHTVNNQIKSSNISVSRNRDRNTNASKTSSAPGTGVSRSSSVRKLTKYSSRRAKLAVRSFKLKLTTIYEGSVLRLS